MPCGIYIRTERSKWSEKRRVAFKKKMTGRKHSLEARLKMSKSRKGIVFSEEHRKNLGLAHLGKNAGEKNGSWVGDNIGYLGLHEWVYRNLGKAKKCEFCGKEKTTPKSIQWANKYHIYNRRCLADWLSLCVPCHRRYDYDNHLSDIGSRGGSIPNKLLQTKRY